MSIPDRAQVLQKRLEKEATRRAKSVDETRDELLEEALDHAHREREGQRVRDGLSADLLLVTATIAEFQELRAAAGELALPFEKRTGPDGLVIHSLGTIGGERVAVFRAPMGPFAALACLRARDVTIAKVFILVGTAFGARTQPIGTVLLANSAWRYDDCTVVDADVPEGCKFEPTETTHALPDEAWTERLRRAAAALRLDGKLDFEVQEGSLLTGGARIESAVYRQRLVDRVAAHGHAIVGGEMESSGLAALCADGASRWAAVKAVSDHADRESRARIEDTRGPAARNAARFVLRALQLPRE